MQDQLDLVLDKLDTAKAEQDTAHNLTAVLQQVVEDLPAKSEE